MRARVALPLLVTLSLAGAGARAEEAGDPIARAKAEMARLDFDAAIALLEQAEASGKNDRDAMLAIFRAMAESHAAMGRAAAAETAFRQLLALDPTAELPAGSSPKLTGPFAAAREFLAGRRIAIECRPAAGGATLVVASDPVDLVAGGRLLAADGARLGQDASGRGRVSLAARGGAAPAGCAALDRHGNLIARADLAAPPAPEIDPAAPPPDDQLRVGGATSGPPARAIYLRWWPYAALGAAAGGVALFYGLKTRQAEDDLEELHAATAMDGHDVTYADALAVQERGERHARNTNIALVVTGVFAAVSGGLLIHQLVAGGEPAEAPAVSATAAPGAAGLQVSVGF